MNSNKFFSFNRFYLLLRSDLLINYKKYCLAILVTFILGFVFLYGSMPRLIYGNEMENRSIIFSSSRYMYIFLASIAALGALAGSSFPDLGSKVKTSNYLLIPASTFEKFSSQFFIRVICGAAIFLVLFWIDARLARAISVMQMVDIKTNLHYANAEHIIDKFNYGMIFLYEKGISYSSETGSYPIEKIVYYKPIETWGTSLFIVSIGLYLFSVRLFFKKLGLVKSIISFVALFFILFLFMVLFSHIFYPRTVGFDMSLPTYTLQKGINNVELWLFLIGFVSPLFLLPLGYFKLKEKQL
jgi:hypothetical protein